MNLRTSRLLLLLLLLLVGGSDPRPASAQKPPPKGRIIPQVTTVPGPYKEQPMLFVLGELCRLSNPAFTIEYHISELPDKVSVTFTTPPFLEVAVRTVLSHAKQHLTYRIDDVKHVIHIQRGEMPTLLHYSIPTPEELEERRSGPAPEIAAPVGHSGDITAIVPSPDGRIVATAGSEGNVLLWYNGRQLRSFPGQLSRSAFDKTGRKLYIAYDMQVVIWDVATGARLETRRFDARVLSVSCRSKDNMLLISLDNGKAYWKSSLSDTGRGLPLPDRINYAFFFSTTGRYAVGIPRGGTDKKPAPLLLWDENTRQLTPLYTPEPISDAALSADEKWLAIGTNRARVVIHPLNETIGKRAGLCLDKGGPLSTAHLTDTGASFSWTPTTVTFHPKLPVVAAGSGGGLVYFWNVVTGQPIVPLQAHQMRYSNLGASALSFDREGSRLYTGARAALDDADRERIKVWDMASLRSSTAADRGYLGSLRAATEGIQQLCIDTTFGHIAAVTDRSVRLWDTTMQDRPRLLHAAMPAMPSPDDDARWFVARDTNGLIPGMPVPEAIKPIEAAPAPEPHLSEAERLKKAAAAAAAARKAATAKPGPVKPTGVQGLVLFDRKTGTPLRRFAPCVDATGQCEALTMHAYPSGLLALAAAGWQDRRIYLWDAATGVPYFPLTGGHSQQIERLEFSADGSYLISLAATRSENNKELAVWDVLNGTLLHTPGRQRPTPKEDPPAQEDPAAKAAREDAERIAWQGYPEKGAEAATLGTLAYGRRDDLGRRSFRETPVSLIAVSSGWPDFEIRCFQLPSGAPVGEPIRGVQAFFRPNTDNLYVVNGSQLEHWIFEVSSDENEPLAGEWRRQSIMRDTNRPLYFSPDSDWIICRASNGTDIKVWQRRGQSNTWVPRTYVGHHGQVEAALIARRRLWSAAQDGTVRVWDLDDHKLIATLIGMGYSDYVVAAPDNYYMATKSALTQVSFRLEDASYPFDQFDLRLHRPDILMERLGGAPAKEIEKQHTLWELRAKRFKLTNPTEPVRAILKDLPSVAFTEHKPVPVVTTDTLPLSIVANDTKHALKELLVYVNDVPVALPSEVAQLSGNAATREWSVTLMPGRNKIQVSVRNDYGVESLRLVEDVICNLPPRDPTLYLITIGVSRYQNASYNLTYADKDAKEVLALFTTLRAPTAPPTGSQARRPTVATWVPPVATFASRADQPRYGQRYTQIRSLPLLNENATREKLLREIPLFLQAARPEDHVVVFLAGHGTRHTEDQKYYDEYFFGTHNWDLNRLPETAVSMSELDALLGACTARQKLLLLDTCYSGSIIPETAPRNRSVSQAAPAATALPSGKARGVGVGITATASTPAVVTPRNEPDIDWAEVLQDTFADLEHGSGTQIIAASSGSKVAYEDHKLGNGIFTASLKAGFSPDPKRNGFRAADTDSDGRITIQELHRFVAQRVYSLSSGKQKPTVPRENIEFDFPLLAGSLQRR